MAAVELFLWLNRLVPKSALSAAAETEAGEIDTDIMMDKVTAPILANYYRQKHPELARHLSLEFITHYGLVEQRRLLAMPTVVIIERYGQSFQSGRLFYVLQATRHKYHVCEYDFLKHTNFVHNLITGDFTRLHELLKLYEKADCCIVAPLLEYPPDVRYFLNTEPNLQLLNGLLMQMNQELLTVDDLPIIYDEQHQKVLSKTILQKLVRSYVPSSLPLVKFPQTSGIYLSEDLSKGNILVITLPAVRSVTTGRTPLRLVNTFSVFGFRSKVVKPVSEVSNLELAMSVTPLFSYKQLNRFNDGFYLPDDKAMSEMMCWLRALLGDYKNVMGILNEPNTSNQLQPSKTMRYTMKAVAMNIMEYCGLNISQISPTATEMLNHITNTLNTVDVFPEHFVYEWLDATMTLAHFVRPMVITNRMVFKLLIPSFLGSYNVAPSDMEWRIHNCCVEIRSHSADNNKASSSSSSSLPLIPSLPLKVHLMLSGDTGVAYPRVQPGCSSCIYGGDNVILSSSDFRPLCNVLSLHDTVWSQNLATKTNRLCSLLCSYAGISTTTLTLGTIYKFIVQFFMSMGVHSDNIRSRNISEMLLAGILPPFFVLLITRYLLGMPVVMHTVCPRDCLEYIFLSFCLDMEPQHSILLYSPTTCNYHLLHFDLDYKNLFVIDGKQLLYNHIYRKLTATMEDLTSGSKKLLKAVEVDSILRDASCFFYGDY